MAKAETVKEGLNALRNNQIDKKSDSGHRHEISDVDGLTTALHDADIARLAGAAPTPDALCRALVTQTLMAGAPDNVSVVCIFALGSRR